MTLEMKSPNSIVFGSCSIGAGHPVMVIAEIGINHEGDVAVACEMVEKAVDAGADAIKLQTADPNENYAPDTSSYAIYKKSFLGPEKTAKVFETARNLGVEPFTTTGLRTFDWVERLNPTGYKISSGTLTHIPLVKKAAQTGRPLLMSTGIATHAEIDEAVAVAKASGAEDLGLMQCTSLYPCPDECIDLASIAWLREAYGCPVGFSDHTEDAQTAAFSVAAGATFIEKHFSLTPGKKSFDHHLSLGPEQFRKMVDDIRRVEKLLGSASKPLRAVEAAQHMRRCLVVLKTLKKGHELTEDDIGFMRTNDSQGALLPSQFECILGARLAVDMEQFAVITADRIEI